MESRDALAKLGILTVLTIGLTAGLHELGNEPGLRIDWTDPVGWVGDSSPEDAVAATLRSIGLVIGYWVGITTALYTAASLRRRVHQPQLVKALTLPGIRRIVDRALAAALVASIAASPVSPAVAEQPTPTPVVFDVSSDGIPVPHIRPNTELPDGVTTESASARTQPAMRPTPVPPVIPASNSAHRTGDTTHTVQAGDNLWRIAEQQLRVDRTDDPTQAVITAYWRDLVAANQETLRSGDPNLIFPGEILVLPDLASTE